MKNNILPFYVGQKVVCVEQDTSGSLIIGKTYTVTLIENQCCCGYLIGVDSHRDETAGRIPIKKGESIRCGGCLKIVVSSGFATYLRNRFRPLKEIKVPLLTFEKIKEEEKEEILILN